MSNSAYISTIFKGGDSDKAELDAKDVISTIAGFQESMEIISRQVYGKDSYVICKLKPPKEGSFELNYIFEISVITASLFENIAFEQLPDVFAYLVEIFKQLNNEKVKKIEQNNSNGDNVYLENGATVIINNNFNLNLDSNKTRELLNNDDLRDSISKHVEPISNNKSKSVTYKNSNRDVITNIDRNSYKSFSRLTSKITEEEREMTLSVIGLSFDKKQWRFIDDLSGEKFSAKIEDESFQKKIKENESFTGGDKLIANVHITYSDKENVNNKYIILKVIRHEVTLIQQGF